MDGYRNALDRIEIEASDDEWQEIVYGLVELEDSAELTPASVSLLDLLNKFGIVG